MCFKHGGNGKCIDPGCTANAVRQKRCIKHGSPVCDDKRKTKEKVLASPLRKHNARTQGHGSAITGGSINALPAIKLEAGAGTSQAPQKAPQKFDKLPPSHEGTEAFNNNRFVQWMIQAKAAEKTAETLLLGTEQETGTAAAAAATVHTTSASAAPGPQGAVAAHPVTASLAQEKTHSSDVTSLDGDAAMRKAAKAQLQQMQMQMQRAAKAGASSAH